MSLFKIERIKIKLTTMIQARAISLKIIDELGACLINRSMITVRIIVALESLSE